MGQENRDRLCGNSNNSFPKKGEDLGQVCSRERWESAGIQGMFNYCWKKGQEFSLMPWDGAQIPGKAAQGAEHRDYPKKKDS